MRIHRSTARKLAPMLALVLGAGVLTGTAPAQADVAPLAWNDCPDWYSCYFQHENGGGWLWKAPSNGCFEFEGSLRNAISSIWNRGRYPVFLYDTDSGRAVRIDEVAAGAKRSYLSGDWRNDATDMVCI